MNALHELHFHITSRKMQVPGIEFSENEHPLNLPGISVVYKRLHLNHLPAVRIII